MAVTMLEIYRRARLAMLQQQLNRRTLEIDRCITVNIRACIDLGERRWRWSWLWMRWEPLALPEDYTFREAGRLEGMEPWLPN